MSTKSTKIKDFNVGDTFSFYGEIFEVTGEVKEWIGHNGPLDTTPCYGRQCKIVSTPKHSNISDILLNYNWMQGIEEVTYAKIVKV